MDKKRKRSSILKRRPILDVASPTDTTYTRQSRRISFSEKNLVKEFMAGEEVATIWGTSYEEQTETMNIAVAAAAKVQDNVNNLEADNSVMVLRKGKFVVKTPHEANLKKTKKNKKEQILPEHDKENIMVGALDIFQSNKEQSINDQSRVSPTANVEEVDMELSVCLDETEKPAPIVATESSSTSIATKPVLQDSLDISLTADEIIQYSSKKPNVTEVKETPSKDNVSVNIDPVSKTSLCLSNTEISINPYSSFSFFEKERKKLKRISKCSGNGLIDITLTDIRDFSECSSQNSGQRSRSSSSINPINIESIVEDNMQIDCGDVQPQMDNAKALEETMVFDNEILNTGPLNKAENVKAERYRKTLVFNNDSMFVDGNNRNIPINETNKQIMIDNTIGDVMDISNDGEDDQMQAEKDTKLALSRKTIHFENASLNIDKTCSNHNIKLNKTAEGGIEMMNIVSKNRQTQLFENDSIEKEEFDKQTKSNPMKRKTQIYNGEDIVQDSHYYYNTQSVSEAKRRTVYFDKDDIEAETEHVKRTGLLTDKQNVRKTQIFESDDIVQDLHYSKPDISEKSRKTIHFNKENIDIENQEICSETNKLPKRGRDTQVFLSDDITTSSFNTNKTSTAGAKRKSIHFENADMHEESLRLTEKIQINHEGCDQMDISLMSETSTSHPDFSSKNQTKHESKYFVEENNDSLNFPSNRETMLYNNSNIEIEFDETYKTIGHERSYKNVKDARKTIHEPADIEVENEEDHSKKKILSKYQQIKDNTHVSKSENIIQDSFNNNPTSFSSNRKTIHFNNIDLEMDKTHLPSSITSFKENDAKETDNMDLSLILEPEDAPQHENQPRKSHQTILTNITHKEIAEDESLDLDIKEKSYKNFKDKRQTIYDPVNIEIEEDNCLESRNQQMYNKTNETFRNQQKHNKTSISDTQVIVPDSVNNNPSTSDGKRKTTHFLNASLDMDPTCAPSSGINMNKNKINAKEDDCMDLSLTPILHTDIEQCNNTKDNIKQNKSRATTIFKNSHIEVENYNLTRHEKSYRSFNEKRQTIHNPIDIETEETNIVENAETYPQTLKSISSTFETEDIPQASHCTEQTTSDSRKTIYFNNADLDMDQSSAVTSSKEKTNDDTGLNLPNNKTESKTAHSNLLKKKVRQTTFYNNTYIDIEKDESAALAKHEKTCQNNKRQTIIEPIDIEADETDVVSKNNRSKSVVNESTSVVLPNKLMLSKSVILGQQKEKSLHDRLNMSTEAASEHSTHSKYHSKADRKTNFTNSIMAEDKASDRLRKVDETRKTILCSNEEMDITTSSEDVISGNTKEIQSTCPKVVEKCETSTAKNMTIVKLSPNKRNKSQRVSLYKKVLTRKAKDRKTILYNNEGIDESTIYDENRLTRTVENEQRLEQGQSQKSQKEIDTIYSVNSCMGQDIDIQNGNNYDNIEKSRSTMADGKRKTTCETVTMQFDEQSDDFQQKSVCHQSFNSNKKYKSDKSRIDESGIVPNVISKPVGNTDSRKTILFSDARIEDDKTAIRRGEKSCYGGPLSTKNKRQTIFEPVSMDIEQEPQCNLDHPNNVYIPEKENQIHRSVSHKNQTETEENNENAAKIDGQRGTIYFSNNEKNYDRMDTTLSPEHVNPARKTIIFEECENDINSEQTNQISNAKNRASSFHMDQSKPELRAEPIDDTGTNPYILPGTPRNLQRTISFHASQCLSTPNLSRKSYQNKEELYTPRRNLYETTADYFEAAELECFEELEDIAKDQSIAQDIAKDCFNRSTKTVNKSNKKPAVYNKTLTESEEVNNRVPKALLKDLRPSFKLSTENLHHALQHETETNEKHIGSSFKHATVASISDPSDTGIAANTSESDERNKTKTTHQRTLHFPHGNEDEMQISICGINNEIKLNNNGNNLTIKSENNNRNVKQTILFTKDNLEISFDGDPHCDNDKDKEDLLLTEEQEKSCMEIGSPLNKSMTNLSDSYTKKQSPRKVMFSKLKNVCHPKRCIIFGDDMNTTINAPSTSKSLQYSPVPENALQEQSHANMDISNTNKELSFDLVRNPTNISDVDQIESNPNTDSHTPILFKKIPRNSIFLINKNRNKSLIGTPDTTEALGNLDIDNITQSSYKRSLNNKSHELTERIPDNGFNNYPELLCQPDIENTRSNLIDSISYEDETHISVESTNSICIIDRRSQNNEDNEEEQPSNIDLCTSVENFPVETCNNAINTSVQCEESLKPEHLCKKCRKCDANRSSLSSIPLKSDLSRPKREIDWSGYERYKNVATFSEVFADQKKRRESMSFQYSTMESSFEESVLEPVVPSIEFLLENYAKQKNKELCDELVEDVVVAAVFPTDRSFIYLLRNKLESNCDWRLDDLLALNGILSFYHKSQKSFYLTLKYSPLELRTNSDIQFESVTFKDNPIYKKLTTLDTIIKSEMLFKVPRDLKYLCWSSLDVFKLLDFVNGHYQNAFTAAKQLHKTVILCGASIETDFRESSYVKKSVKVSTESGMEVKDFKLRIYKIDKISYNDIKTPGLSNFKETVKNLPTGLDFLPSFLSNPIQFLK